MYSENNEEQIIKDFFKGSTGRYLDIGAYDGVKISNTLALAESGWIGTVVEASTKVFQRLEKNYKERNLTNVELINAAYVPESYPDYVEFHEILDGNGLGSLTKNNILSRPEWNKNEISSFKVNTIKPSKLFANPDFKFISIDVERMNLETMVTIPWNLLTNLELFCIELDNDSKRYTDFMSHLNWKVYTQEDVNLFFVKNF